MTYYQSSAMYYSTSDASFRVWAAKLIECLAAIGLVQTTDAGQINTATVIKPVTNAYAGYAIFRFSDSYQSTRPVFIKINFGGSSNSNLPSFQITVGKGSDGVGNITGVLYTSSNFGLGYNSNVGDWRCYGNGGTAVVMPAVTNGPTGSGAQYVAIERSPDGKSLLVMDSPPNQPVAGNTYSTTHLVSVIAYDTGLVASGAPPVILPFRIAGSILTGGTPLSGAALAPVFPWVLFPPGEAPWQSRALLSYPGGDAPSTPFSVTLEGEDRTYNAIPLSDAYSAFGLGINGGTSTGYSRYVGLAIRWQ